MNYFLKISVALLLAFMIVKCSGSEQTTEEKTSDDNYIFDKIPVEKVTSPVKPTIQPGVFYVVQIGAFSSEQNAEDFARKSRLKLGMNIIVSFSDNVKLFVVQLDPPFQKKEDAEKIRDKLWRSDEFRDAWIFRIRNND